MRMNEFKQFLRNYRFQLIVAYMIVLVSFGFMLTNHTISIDEETRLANTGTGLTWITQGRFGIVLLNLLFSPSGDYAPFLWDFLAVSLWFFSGVLSYYILFEQSGFLKNKSAALVIYCAYYATVPLVAGEILAFSMFNLQVAIAMNMTMLAFAFLLQWVLYSKRACLLWAISLLTFAVSVYQAFLCVAATMTVAYLLLAFQNGTVRPFKLLMKALPVFAASILLYSAITFLLSAFIQQGGYLADSYLGWRDERAVFYALFATVANVVRLSFGLTIRDLTIYGGLEIGFASCSLLAFSILRTIRTSTLKGKAACLALTALLFAAPFSLYLILGTHNTAGRMLLGMPIVQGLGIVMLLEELKSKRVHLAALLLAGLLLFLNARNMNTLFYYGSVAYRHDVATAHHILHDIQESGADYHQKPVIFIGKHEMDHVKMVSSGTIGQSFFAWDDGNNGRIADFYNTLGYAFMRPNRAQCSQAAELTKSMNAWPASGSILTTEEMIIVFLSPPTEQWYKVNAT